MKIAYTAPLKDEIYLISKKAAMRDVRSLCPEMPLLGFQTMHVPKMSPSIPYLVTFSLKYIRFLSVRPDLIAADLGIQFPAHVVPYICEAVALRHKTSYSWPTVIVALNGVAYEVTCSDGGLMPNHEEIHRDIKRHRRAVFSYDPKSANNSLLPKGISPSTSTTRPLCRPF